MSLRWWGGGGRLPGWGTTCPSHLLCQLREQPAHGRSRNRCGGDERRRSQPVAQVQEPTCTTGLPGGGNTGHYLFRYDDSLSSSASTGGPEPARTISVMSASEGDFNLLEGWFGNIALDVYVPISINITTLTGGAHWSIPPSSTNLTIDIYSGRNGSASFIRYLLVSEMSEQFMRAQGRGWFGTGTEGSAGEGLSRFLATQFLAVNGLGSTPTGYDVSNLWLASRRADYVNFIDPTDIRRDERTGCSL